MTTKDLIEICLWILRACLDPLSFYKKYFLAIAQKNWFLKEIGWGCLETSF
jgi:hypothetical protein